MRITEEQYKHIVNQFLIQRGNVKIDNRSFFNAILYMTANECKWRALPKEFGKRRTIYKKLSRWTESGGMRRLFVTLQAEKIIAVHVEAPTLDSTSCKVHSDAHGL